MSPADGPKPLQVLALYRPVCPVDEAHVCFTYTTPASLARRGGELRCPARITDDGEQCGALLQNQPRRASDATS